MSNRYGASGRLATAPAAGGLIAEVRASATRRMVVEEITVSLGAATATTVALGRATSQGAGGSAVVGQQEDLGAPAGTGSLVLPTFTTAPPFNNALGVRRVTLSPAVGALVSWTWDSDDRLVIPAGSSVVLWNAGAAAGAAVIDLFVVYSE